MCNAAAETILTMTDNSKNLLHKKITDLTEISPSNLEKIFENTTQREIAQS